MREIEIVGRKIGDDHPPLVIVEIGINHEGSFEKAIQCVDAAIESGAALVKFQTHITEKEMIPTDMTPGTISKEKLWDIIKRCELSEDEERQLQRYCIERGVMYLSTPFSREAADRLNKMNVPAFKIGSGECNNLPLLEHIARMGKPMILSTGMNDLDSVRRSVATIKRFDVPWPSCIVRACTPPLQQGTLGRNHPTQGGISGFADRPVRPFLGIWTCLGAVALGASMLEKHFTISRAGLVRILLYRSNRKNLLI